MENHLWFMVVTRLQNLRDSSTCRQLEGGGGIERRERGGERERKVVKDATKRVMKLLSVKRKETQREGFDVKDWEVMTKMQKNLFVP